MAIFGNKEIGPNAALLESVAPHDQHVSNNRLSQYKHVEMSVAFASGGGFLPQDAGVRPDEVCSLDELVDLSDCRQARQVREFLRERILIGLKEPLVGLLKSHGGVRGDRLNNGNGWCVGLWGFNSGGGDCYAGRRILKVMDHFVNPRQALRCSGVWGSLNKGHLESGQRLMLFVVTNGIASVVNVTIKYRSIDQIEQIAVEWGIAEAEQPN